MRIDSAVTRDGHRHLLAVSYCPTTALQRAPMLLLARTTAAATDCRSQLIATVAALKFAFTALEGLTPRSGPQMGLMGLLLQAGFQEAWLRVSPDA